MKHSLLLAIAAISLSLISIPAKSQDAVPMHTFGIEDNPTTKNNFNLWTGEYEKSSLQFVVGYVNKSWRCDYGSIKQREDFFGDPDDKYLHGMQFGVLYTPSFDWGLGLRTGLCFESYISRSRWITVWCNHFSEADLYIPLHASFRIPIDDQCAINIFGGAGFQWAMSGRYYRRIGTAWKWWGRHPGFAPIYESMKHYYGNGWPQKVNWQAECGLNFRFKCIALSFTYSFGIYDHRIQNTFDEGATFVTANKSYQDKMQATISFVLPEF